jgi:hypothetical protein
MRRFLLFLALALSCNGQKGPPKPPAPPPTFFLAQRTDARFYTANHMLASIEMQISGEPFSQLLGYNLTGFNRFDRTTDQYVDPATMATRTDPLGYATAIESYEYSKQPMNNLSFESGAGLSLMFSSLQNPSNLTGDDAFNLLVNRLQHLADLSNSGGPPGRNFVVSPPPLSNPFNFYGWPGFWPQFAEFRSFDPAITPPLGATRGCTFTGGYAAAAMGAQVVGDYECGYNGLNLNNRDAQVEKVLSPDAMGYAMWKQALWVINYWQSMHDTAGNPITQVADADLPMVGAVANTVVGQYADPTDPTGKRMINGMPGVFLGDITIEGWQGLVMMDEMDAKGRFLLASLSTGDGVQLGGFASTKDAIAYDYAAPLRWWPSQVAVTETVTAPSADLADKYFPQPTTLAIKDASSRLGDLTALAGGFGTWFALSDFHNDNVGGQASSRATFDGDPLPADNLLPDGEETPHDRALAVLKMALIDVDRLHWDQANQVLVDSATVAGGQVTRGTTVTTLDAAYAIVGMRQAMRAIASTLALYSNDTPDTHGLPTALDGSKGAEVVARAQVLIAAEAEFIANTLVAADGSVANSYDLAAGKRDDSPTLLQSEASAIRGLLEAYLATSNEKYREAAARVYADLDKRFWMTDVRAFRTTAGVDDPLTYTPLQFATLEGALRQYWKLVARRPGQEKVATELLSRFKRHFKLVVNGWDDANADDKVQYKDECTGAGLQMGERALTGELARPSDAGDRDQDCVPEISTVMLPSALAGQIVLTRRKP